MKSIELILLVFAYTLVIIAIFIELICYKKNLEKLETIVFTVSLLLLIVSMTISPFIGQTNVADTTNVFTLLAITLVGLTTPLSIMVERKHKIPAIYKKLLYIFSIALFISTITAYFFNALKYIEYIVIGFLITSVMLSMILVRVTKPKQFIAHREKTERIFAIVFLIVLPISIWGNYLYESQEYELKLGFTLPLLFILLSASKILDNLQRLSLFSTKENDYSAILNNYSISNREKEVVLLLIQGKSYKEVSAALNISMPTVKSHSSNIYKKTGVKNRTELAALIIG